MSEATKEKAKLSIINEANDERSDAFDAVTDAKVKKSKGVPGEDDERNSLHSEEDEYDEIDMGEIDEIKAPKMDVIEEAPEELQLTDPVERAPSPISKKKKAKAEEQKATIHDSFDTFIVNDYFGEEDK